MDDTMDSRNEDISALADGRLDGDAFAAAVQAVCGDREAMATWHTYHVIGDVLRSGEAAYAAPAAPFLARLSERLAQEECPRPAAGNDIRPIQVRAAANDGVFRWKLVAGVASVAAVAAVGWSVVAPGFGPASAQLASASTPASRPATVLAATGQGVMIRDPRLDELMAAHRQFGGASALQMPAGFLRNATFEGPAR
jgi:sigma-E factor negative regulatory protein RseA